MKGSVRCMLLAASLVGCATVPTNPLTAPPPPLPSLHGSYYQVKPGETLWRIAHVFGLDVETLAGANRLPNTTQLRVGQRLFIPLPPESRQFFWPLRGTLASPATSKGLEIVSEEGSLVRAARSGRVAVATRQLSGWGKTVILDHLDGFYTVYAGLDQLLVSPGSHVRQGSPVGSLGVGPLHFQVRYGATIREALPLLPRVD